jgi:50S ribosomal protein uL30
MADEGLFAVVRLRGCVKAGRKVRDTLDKLRLTRVNSCVLVPSSPSNAGMLKKAAGFLTWGEVNEDVLESMLEKRGRNFGGKKMEGRHAKSVAEKMLKGKADDEVGVMPVFCLSPPRKGLRSVRLMHPRGDLGYRGEDINSLLKRMI